MFNQVMFDKLINLYHSNKMIRTIASKPYKKSHLESIVFDILDKRFELQDNFSHCNEAIKWLCRAQDINDDGGVSGSYNFHLGWMPSYPETTGYIISTFFDYSKFYKKPSQEEIVNRALRMADWLVEIQLENGSFCGPEINSKMFKSIKTVKNPIVFDTGQALMGLIKSYENTKNIKYMESAIYAGDWLIRNQELDGSWKNDYNNIPHAYHSYVSWPLIFLSKMSRNNEYEIAAIKNLDWVLRNQNSEGWFNNNSFKKGMNPYTHNIGYVLEGLIESGILLNEEKFINVCIKPAETLLRIYSIKGFLPASFDKRWDSKDTYTCLTGNAQISLIWLKLFKITGDARYLNGAIKMNEDLKSMQNIYSKNCGIRGGIKGSHPIYDNYMSFTFPNWATKFFIDALMLEDIEANKIGNKGGLQ